ncbi:rCG44110 [Rattus norvegicus]|uniref:RCG44110 n=1 Tax=Rattus norvegicus TaxID=10116 RepID=A6J6Y1_RAT|nr:rCG44110 [Rattus norvegicus]
MLRFQKWTKYSPSKKKKSLSVREPWLSLTSQVVIQMLVMPAFVVTPFTVRYRLL